MVVDGEGREESESTRSAVRHQKPGGGKEGKDRRRPELDFKSPRLSAILLPSVLLVDFPTSSFFGPGLTSFSTSFTLSPSTPITPKARAPSHQPPKIMLAGSTTLLLSSALLLLQTSSISAAGSSAPESTSAPIVDPWAEKGYSSLGDLSFSGPVTFAHLPFESCLNEASTEVDVAILGLPYDLSVSYRPGEF